MFTRHARVAAGWLSTRGHQLDADANVATNGMFAAAGEGDYLLIDMSPKAQADICCLHDDASWR